MRAGILRESESEPGSGTAPGRRRLLTCLLAAAVAAGLGAVTAVTLTQHHGPATASTHLDQARVESGRPRPVWSTSGPTLQYRNEVSVDTGIVWSADGLVLTSNNDIADSTSVTATLVWTASHGATHTTRMTLGNGPFR